MVAALSLHRHALGDVGYIVGALRGRRAAQGQRVLGTTAFVGMGEGGALQCREIKSLAGGLGFVLASAGASGGELALHKCGEQCCGEEDGKDQRCHF